MSAPAIERQLRICEGFRFVALFCISARPIAIVQRIAWIFSDGLVQQSMCLLQVAGDAIRHGKLIRQDSVLNCAGFFTTLLEFARLLKGDCRFGVMLLPEQALAEVNLREDVRRVAPRDLRESLA